MIKKQEPICVIYLSSYIKVKNLFDELKAVGHETKKCAYCEKKIVNFMKKIPPIFNRIHKNNN